jgi:hypothetical protein
MAPAVLNLIGYGVEAPPDNPAWLDDAAGAMQRYRYAHSTTISALDDSALALAATILQAHRLMLTMKQLKETTP